MPAAFEHRLRYWGFPVLWMVLIFAGSSIPGREADRMTRDASGVDDPVHIQRIKDIVHITEYTILSLLLCRTLGQDKKRPTHRHAVYGFLVAALYGVSDELHQLFVPFRYPGLDDIIRNTVGAGTGALLWLGWKRAKPASEEQTVR